MISYCKCKSILSQNWPLCRFIFCQKNSEKRQLIRTLLSCDVIIPRYHFQNRFYISTPISRIGIKKEPFSKKYSNKTSAILGVSNEKVASKLKSKRNVIKNVDDIEKFEKISEFLSSVNISPSDKDIKDIVFTRNLTASVIEERYHCLKEMGFTNISIETLFRRYNSLMKETVVTLHSLGELACDVHPLDLLIATADAPPNLADIINTKYKSLRSGPVYSIHHAIMLEFLVSKLNSSHQKILNLFKKYPRVRLRSFHSIKQMLKILIEDVGLSEKKIESNGFLLCLNSREVSSLLESLPSLLIDINVTELIKKIPVILSVQVENMKKIVKLFQQYDITPEHIMKKGNILTLHPDTVSERLKILEETPELNQMKSNPRYLLLVYLYNKVLERMECLKKMDLRITLSVLCDSEARFQNYISTPEDRLLRTEIEEHLSTQFNVEKTLIHDKIDHYHIDAKVISVDKINKRIKFLEQNNVPKEDVLKNLSVLLLSEQDLLKNIQGEALASLPLELNFENHADVHMQNALLQGLLNFMKNQQKYGRPSIDEQLDVDEFVRKL